MLNRVCLAAFEYHGLIISHTFSQQLASISPLTTDIIWHTSSSLPFTSFRGSSCVTFHFSSLSSSSFLFRSPFPAPVSRADRCEPTRFSGNHPLSPKRGFCRQNSQVRHVPVRSGTARRLSLDSRLSRALGSRLLTYDSRLLSLDPRLSELSTLSTLSTPDSWLSALGSRLSTLCSCLLTFDPLEFINSRLSNLSTPDSPLVAIQLDATHFIPTSGAGRRNDTAAGIAGAAPHAGLFYTLTGLFYRGTASPPAAQKTGSPVRTSCPAHIVDDNWQGPRAGRTVTAEPEGRRGRWRRGETW